MAEPRFSGMEPCLWDSAVEMPLGQHIGLVNKSTGKTSLQLLRVCLLGTAVDGARAGDEQVCWPGLLPLSPQHTACFLLYSGHMTLTFSIPKHSLCTCGKVSQLHDCHASIWPYLSVLGSTA